MGRKVLFIRIPNTAQKIIESTNTGSITEFKTTENSIKRVDFELGSPLRQGSNFKIQRQKIGTVHAGRSSWLRTKNGILIFEFFVGVGKVKIPKAVNDIPCGTRDGIRNRIVFTKICNNKVLVGGMTAGINR